ncbi:BTB/POZ domain-containing protein 8-like [Montipora capricornis]|uniref:BTB/POZ domain-containing protein 8-like n=1 Tax=Montipora capricornis TaxID=246305 RepID=UPI0035F152C1
MNSKSFSKSQAFKDRENNAREKIRQVVKQDLVADLSRLFGDTTFSDVFFIVKNVEFHGHTVILRARAPNFCHRFLPSYTSTLSVQTCIQIHGLEASQFETFLRSAYIDDDFKDYDESSYPWRRQSKSRDAHHNNFVDDFCTPELNNMNSSDHKSDLHSNVEQLSILSFNEQLDKTCTQSECSSDLSNLEETTIGIPQNHDQVEDINKLSRHDSCECVPDMRFDNTENRKSPSLNDALLLSDTSVMNTLSLEEDTDQFDYGTLVDSLDKMTIDERHPKYVSKATQTMSDMDTNGILANGVTFDGDKKADEELILKSENGTGINGLPQAAIPAKEGKVSEISQSDLEHCSCKLGQDLLHLLLSGIGSDITLLVNGVTVKAHKAILCARSNYFSAMLLGDWVEGKSNVISLVGINYSGLMTVLKYIYGGIAHVENDLAIICDTMPLVDMYGLEGLKEVIICSLKIEKCHLFHKPCIDCVAGVFECLEASELFSLDDLKNSCIKWITKHFDRVLGTKGFATLPDKLQEDILTEINKSFVISCSIEVLNQCDKLSCCTPLVKWTEPVHAAVSSIQESCLLFISDNFFSLVDEGSFHEILKGVGWSIPVLEKIIFAVKKNLSIENCCDQLKAILKLKRLMKLRTLEESDDYYPEEVSDLVGTLHNDCVKFIRGNLFKVTRSQGWKSLKITTQKDIKEGAVFSSLGDLEDFRVAMKGRNAPKPAASLSRPTPTKRPGLDSRTRGTGRGNPTAERQANKRSNAERPSLTGGLPTRTVDAMKIKRSARQPSSAQSSNGSSSVRNSSLSSNDASHKRPVSFLSSAASGTSKLSSQLSAMKKNSDKTSSYTVGRGKTLPLKSSSDDSKTRQSSPASATSSTKKRNSCTEGNSKEKLSRRGSSGPKKSQEVSRPSMPRSNTESTLSKNLKGKTLSPAVRFSFEAKESQEDPKPFLSRSKTENTLSRNRKEKSQSSVTNPAWSTQRQADSRPSLPRSKTDSELSKALKERTLNVEGPSSQTEKAPNGRQQRARETIKASSACNSNEPMASAVVKDSSRRKVLFRDVAGTLCSSTQTSKDDGNDLTSNVDRNGHS